MCEYHGPLPGRRAADDSALPRLPALSLDRVDHARLILLARHLHLRLAAGPLATGLPDSAAGRLTRVRDCAASLIRLANGSAANPALLRPLLDGYARRCSEKERKAWLDCAGAALNHARLGATEHMALWRWFEILSLRLLHARAAADPALRYLYPPRPTVPAGPPADAGRDSAHET